MLGNLRPQLARHATFEEAFDAVAAIEAAEAAAEAAGLPTEESDSDEDDARRHASDSEDGRILKSQKWLMQLALATESASLGNPDMAASQDRIQATKSSLQPMALHILCLPGKSEWVHCFDGQPTVA